MCVTACATYIFRSYTYIISYIMYEHVHYTPHDAGANGGDRERAPAVFDLGTSTQPFSFTR